MLRAAIYCRVSTDEQTRNYSLPTQLAACREHARARGYEVVAEFQEDCSGASLDRPELDKLRQLVREGNIQIVLVYDVDRLARKVVYQLLIEDEFEKAGARTEYVLGQYDDSPEGTLLKQVRSAVAEFERLKIMERTQRGMRGRVQSGLIIPGRHAPYGYRIRREGQHVYLEIDEEEAQVVRQIYHWYVYGDDNGKSMGIYLIQRRLTELRVPTKYDRLGWNKPKRGPGCWDSSIVQKLLHTKLYKGEWYWTPRKSGDDGVTHTSGTGTAIKVDVPAIIPQELWDAAQKLKGEKFQRSPRNTKAEYLLQGRLKCGRCGRGFLAYTRSNVNKGYYRCAGQLLQEARDFSGKSCHRSLRQDRVDTRVWETIKEALQNPDLIIRSMRQRQAEAEVELETVHERLAAVRKRLANLDEQRAKILDLFLTDHSTIPKDLLHAKMAEISQQYSAFEREAADLVQRIARETIAEETLEQVAAYCEKAQRGIDAFEFKDKLATIQALDITGVVERGETADDDVIILTGYIGLPTKDEGLIAVLSP